MKKIILMFVAVVRKIDDIKFYRKKDTPSVVSQMIEGKYSS